MQFRGYKHFVHPKDLCKFMPEMQNNQFWNIIFLFFDIVKNAEATPSHPTDLVAGSSGGSPTGKKHKRGGYNANAK